jgi:glutathione peroxidase
MRIPALAAAAMLALGAATADAADGAFHFELDSIDGGTLPLAELEGKALLVVNTASLCGFTYQYEQLQAVWEDYREDGLVVLAVPSGDFGGQELESNEAIRDFCEVNFGLDFPMAAKSTVRGPDAHPFFRHVVDVLGPDAAPRWNFHKYLVAPDGALVGSWPSRTEPTDPELRAAIEAVLSR